MPGMSGESFSWLEQLGTGPEPFKENVKSPVMKF